MNNFNKLLFQYLLPLVLLFGNISCGKKLLAVYPDDKIVSEAFWKSENDVKLALYGIYNAFKEQVNYQGALYPFGILDAATPNGFLWGTETTRFVGNGSLTTGMTNGLMDRWVKCYKIIYRANFFLENIDKAQLAPDALAMYSGEAHFLRGMAYALLADSYGGVPIVTKVMTVEESRTIKRASKEATWDQVIADYDVAIGSLQATAPVLGRATKGAALGMKMRAYLYQGKYNEVLNLFPEIEKLQKYGLFSSYKGLFQLANENNKEVLYDIQYMSGENGQGSYYDQYTGIGVGSYTRGTRVVPIQNLVDAYETIDGAPINPNSPYENRDPRLDFTIVRPGAYYLGALYPTANGAHNHPGQLADGFAIRKYLIEPAEDLPPPGQSSLNYIVIRYADVLLMEAEALIETGQDIDKAVMLINRIRTERDDVKITPLPMGMGQEQAREKLRHERRIEFAFEGLYWSDIRRWKIGKDIYPVTVSGSKGLVETKFPQGYQDRYDLLPIPDNERSLNPGLDQNPGW